LSETGSNNAIGDAIVATGESQNGQSNKSEMTLLDLYSGCGAMSTGLCMGASKSGVKLVPVSLQGTFVFILILICFILFIHANGFILII
jgi:hypothetical protein